MKIFPDRFILKFVKENLSFVRLRSSSSARKYRVLFFGSDEVSLKSLQRLNELYKNGNIVTHLELVTANRSRNLSAIEKYAVSEKLKVLAWPVKDLKKEEFDIGVVVSFGHLIPEETICKFPLGMVNVHTSLLPRWRGAAPVVHTLLHGDHTTGVTLMSIKPHQFDIGEIISQESITVSEDIVLPSLTSQLAELGAAMLVRCMESLPACLLAAKPQGEDEVTYAKKIDKSISRIKWANMSARDVYNLHRAIYGVFPLTTHFRGKDVRLLEPFLDQKKIEENRTNELIPGSVKYSRRLDAIKVLCKDKRYVCFKKVRVVGKREITAIDFYNGYLKNISVDDSIFY